jgi:glycosyltransferase involved in cell wall biosynthesis
MKLNKCKILYLALEMDMGGLQRVVNLLIRKINKDKFMPYLCCLDRGGLFYEQLDANSISKYILGRRPGKFDIIMFGKLVRIIKDNRIDIIHSQNGCSAYSALAGRLTGVKAIIHTDHGRLVPERQAAIMEDRYASYLMDRVVGVSAALTKYLAETVKINRRKLVTILNGIEISKYAKLLPEEKRRRKTALGYEPDAMIIGTVCRLDKIKNLDLLIGSIPEIAREMPKCRVVIIGDGPEENHLKEMACRLQVQSKVDFLGRIEDVGKILPIYDLFVNTSHSEGTSMTIVEAMSCSLPIVASAVGGNVELLDQSNGVLFESGNKAEFEKIVLELMKDTNRLERMGYESRKRVERNLSIERAVEQYENLYSEQFNK